MKKHPIIFLENSCFLVILSSCIYLSFGISLPQILFHFLPFIQVFLYFNQHTCSCLPSQPCVSLSHVFLCPSLIGRAYITHSGHTSPHHFHLIVQGGGAFVGHPYSVYFGWRWFQPQDALKPLRCGKSGMWSHKHGRIPGPLQQASSFPQHLAVFPVQQESCSPLFICSQFLHFSMSKRINE